MRELHLVYDANALTQIVGFRGDLAEWAASAAGAFALVENSLYTIDAFSDYFSCLTPAGDRTCPTDGVDGEPDPETPGAHIGRGAGPRAEATVVRSEPPPMPKRIGCSGVPSSASCSGSATSR